MQASRVERREVVGQGSSRLHLKSTDQSVLQQPSSFYRRPQNRFVAIPGTSLHLHAIKHYMYSFQSPHGIFPPTSSDQEVAFFSSTTMNIHMQATYVGTPGQCSVGGRSEVGRSMHYHHK
jgi:hypothetical protein